MNWDAVLGLTAILVGILSAIASRRVREVWKEIFVLGFVRPDGAGEVAVDLDIAPVEGGYRTIQVAQPRLLGGQR